MRTPARVLGLALTFVVMLVGGAGTAFADQPATAAWPEGEGRSTLDTLLVFGGSTVGLFILVALFGLLTARNNYVPPAPSTELEKPAGSAAAHH